MNRLDKQYTDLLQDILKNGTKKETRNGSVISVFGRQIKHRMSEGFPLLTTKKMYFKGIVIELLWFLRGETNIKYLVDNNCHIWDGDCYQAYLDNHIKKTNNGENISNGGDVFYIPDEETKYGKVRPFTKEEFINKIKTDDEFAKKWGELGPIYGKQWRSWKSPSLEEQWGYGEIDGHPIGGKHYGKFNTNVHIDQIANLINDLKTNPDSRRLIVNSWNVGELSEMVLPPCHYSFQVYTRELSDEERLSWMKQNRPKTVLPMRDPNIEFSMDEWFRPYGVPKRAISLMWNQRSVDTPLGLPFNIASYGLLLEIIAKIVNMVPDELIGNLGDCHIYSNQIDGCIEQIGREPLHLPNLVINTEFWSTDSGECGVGLIDSDAILKSLVNDDFCRCLLEDIQLFNYQSHPTIKFPLSN